MYRAEPSEGCLWTDLSRGRTQGFLQSSYTASLSGRVLRESSDPSVDSK